MFKEVTNIYRYICNDKEILDIYRDIVNYEDDTGGWAYHGLDHIFNVIGIMENILNELGFSEDFIIKAKIAGFLHDVGAILGKEGHAIRSYEYAKKYFEKNNILFEDMDLALEAIREHSGGFDVDNMIARVLILADKLDVKRNRITSAGREVIGNRQFYHIEDIYIKISNKIMNIYFIADKYINIKELNEFYFVKKIFRAIESFANSVNLEYNIYMNDNKWIINN